jgi:hypothetical protein
MVPGAMEPKRIKDGLKVYPLKSAGQSAMALPGSQAMAEEISSLSFKGKDVIT